MKDTVIRILNVCTALFVLLYAAYIYSTTASLTLAAVVILIAGLAPALHMAWNYFVIKTEHFEERYFRNYLKR